MNQPQKNRFPISLLAILLTGVLSFSAFAQNGFSDTPPEVASLPAEMQKLPLTIRSWFVYETDYLSRAVDERKIYSPKENSQDPFYAPEAKNIFDLVGYWVPEKEMTVFQSSRLFNERVNQFIRTKNGQKEYLFFIHPESLDLYPQILNRGFEEERFRAVATASSRSLLVWKPGQESTPFIAKVSLNKNIGNLNRAIKGTETAMSVGVSETIEGSSNLPKEGLVMTESLSLIPKGLDRGGMILRQFPKEFFTGQSTFLPLFALYGDRKAGVLLNLLRESNLSPEEYVRQNILRPFVKLWSEYAIEQGILMEPHAQNVLIELRDGKLTGRFVLRDFGGFNIDFVARKRMKEFIPQHLPTFSGNIDRDYYFSAHQENIETSLRTFFEGGFLYNVQNSMNHWAEMGLIKKPRRSFFDLHRRTFDFHDDLMGMLSQTLSEYLKSPVKIGPNYENLTSSVLAAKASFRGITRSCNFVFYSN